ncbi:MAG: DUF4424 domain-containing protein [Gammaproteobacteria bacterium]|nr:DUF4424 domain-containing protein [Gammaproteobacteria bacterium]MBU1776985.1 DUF4424 domain-containing protein [Gammaproteobacteria bacterium]MBU1968564.1 DUF4424 domain-containing protein [Gammaproteobacteria bacterium]
MKYVLLFISLLVANPCVANDSIGYLGAGGVEFKKTADISMDKEVLTISRNLIRVEYEFLNTSSVPTKETIIFPMPFYGFDEGCSPQHSGQLEGFKLWVDGIPQGTSRTVRAMLNDKDVTNRLRELGFADQDIAEYRGVEGNCYSGETISSKGAFSENMQVLSKEGLANFDKEGSFVLATPMWKVAYFYSWDQVFPPKTKVRIAHEYVPFQGSINVGYDFAKPAKLKSTYSDLVKEFCITEGTLRAGAEIQGRITTGSSKMPLGGLSGRTVKYILTTGANWAGPIKDFTLNLKKESKDEIVSLCLDGKLKKQDDLTITSHEKNFTPRKDITAIFFYAPLSHPISSDASGYKPGYRKIKNLPTESMGGSK